MFSSARVELPFFQPVYPNQVQTQLFEWEKPGNYYSPLQCMFARLDGMNNTHSTNVEEWYYTIAMVKSKIQMEIANSVERALAQETSLTKQITVKKDVIKSKRNFAFHLGTVLFVGNNTKKIIALHTMINHGSLKNYDKVNCKTMQADGTLIICQSLSEKYGINLSNFVHDGDQDIMNSVRTIYPSCVEIKCANSASKVVGRWARKNFGPVWAKRIQSAFKHACKNAECKNLEYFRTSLDQSLSHFSGNHTRCHHTQITDSPQLNPEESMLLRNYWETFHFLPDFPQDYSQSMTDSYKLSLESKDILSTLHEIRIWIALIKFNEGFTFVADLFKGLDEALSADKQQVGMHLWGANTIIPGPVMKIKKKKHKHAPKGESSAACACTKGCRNNVCGCRKRGNKCDSSCSCKGCENVPGFFTIDQANFSLNRISIRFLLNS